MSRDALTPAIPLANPIGSPLVPLSMLNKLAQQKSEQALSQAKLVAPSAFQVVAGSPAAPGEPPKGAVSPPQGIVRQVASPDSTMVVPDQLKNPVSQTPASTKGSPGFGSGSPDVFETPPTAARESWFQRTFRRKKKEEGDSPIVLDFE